MIRRERFWIGFFGVPCVVAGLALAAYGPRSKEEKPAVEDPQASLAEARLRRSQQILETDALIGSVFMLNSKRVREELELTAEQIAEAEAVIQQYVENVKLVSPPGGARSASRVSTDSSGDSDPQTEEERLQKLSELRSRYCRQAETLLTPQQLIRLAELSLQLKGIDVFFRPEFLVAMGILQERQAAFGELKRSFSEERQLIFDKYSAKDADKKAFRSALDHQEQQLETDVFALLTDEETSEYRRLLGEQAPFDRTNVRLGIRTNVKKGGSRNPSADARRSAARARSSATSN